VVEPTVEGRTVPFNAAETIDNEMVFQATEVRVAATLSTKHPKPVREYPADRPAAGIV